MTRTAWFSVAGATAVMALALAWGVLRGDLAAEGGALVRMPWGLVTLVEVYVGITLFGCWVFQREASTVRAAAWLLGVILAGNIVSCAYVLLALRNARGDALAFWLGARARPTERSP